MISKIYTITKDAIVALLILVYYEKNLSHHSNNF